MAHQDAQEVELGGRERDDALAAPHLTRGGIQREIGKREDGLVALAGTPQQSADARDEFHRRKGFDEIIVRAALQALDAVLHGVARRQHQDRRFVLLGA